MALALDVAPGAPDAAEPGAQAKPPASAATIGNGFGFLSPHSCPQVGFRKGSMSYIFCSRGDIAAKERPSKKLRRFEQCTPIPLPNKSPEKSQVVTSSAAVTSAISLRGAASGGQDISDWHREKQLAKWRNEAESLASRVRVLHADIGAELEYEAATESTIERIQELFDGFFDEVDSLHDTLQSPQKPPQQDHESKLAVESSDDSALDDEWFRQRRLQVHESKRAVESSDDSDLDDEVDSRGEAVEAAELANVQNPKPELKLSMTMDKANQLIKAATEPISAGATQPRPQPKAFARLTAENLAKLQMRNGIPEKPEKDRCTIAGCPRLHKSRCSYCKARVCKSHTMKRACFVECSNCQAIPAQSS